MKTFKPIRAKYVCIYRSATTGIDYYVYRNTKKEIKDWLADDRAGKATVFKLQYKKVSIK